MGKEKIFHGDEMFLKITKEIVVKFIEMGKVSPASFDETFRRVYETVRSVARDKKDKESN